MNNTHHLIKQKKAALKRRELSKELSNLFGRDVTASLDISVAQEISHWTKNQILFFRNQTPSPFIRLDLSTLEQTLYQKFSEIQFTDILITFVHWQYTGAIQLSRGEFLANAVQLISFDGDGYFGCSKEKDVVISVDYDPDYPGSVKYEILAMNI
jgi:hypothetical protein